MQVCWDTPLIVPDVLHEQISGLNVLLRQYSDKAIKGFGTLKIGGIILTALGSNFSGPEGLRVGSHRRCLRARVPGCHVSPYKRAHEPAAGRHPEALGLRNVGPRG